MRPARALVVALILLPGLLPLACGDDDTTSATTPVPSPSAASATPPIPPTTAVTSPTPVATPTPTPPSLAEQLAKDPQYFLYVAGRGDTIAFVARAFNGQPGTAKAGFPGQIRDVNQLTSDSLVAGQVIAVPLLLGGAADIVPTAGMEIALSIGEKAGKLVLLQPSVAMRDEFRGRLVLHRVQLADDDPAGEGYGYVTEYWLSDRAAFKGGTVDPEARVMEPAFLVAGGSLVTQVLQSSKPGDIYTFDKGGTTYVIKKYSGAQLAAADLAKLLHTSAER
ncbi:MAG: LysM peptidoglycan-binding domain-containing protein [Dehalococcoidia bacterium]|nr:LysM peptidoglycan-binding domain-containing protein [Dehalococcoidia bacterium]